MNGVEILSKTQILEYQYPVSNALIFTLVFLGFCFICIGFSIVIEGKHSYTGMATFFFGLFLFSFMVSGKEKPTGEYEYKVTISDDVNFNDFYDKYEIVSQDGKIYVVKEN